MPFTTGRIPHTTKKKADAKLLNRVNHRMRLFHIFLCVDRHHPVREAAVPEATIASMMNVCCIV